MVINPVEKDCRILVNGSAISGETKLDHNDRIVVGSTHIWIFQNPLEKGIDKKVYPPITYEYAQEEIAAKAGINIQSGDSTDVAALHEDLIEVMPAVEEANSISEELDKRVKFEIILIAPNKLGDLKGIYFKRNYQPPQAIYFVSFIKDQLCARIKVAGELSIKSSDFITTMEGV